MSKSVPRSEHFCRCWGDPSQERVASAHQRWISFDGEMEWSTKLCIDLWCTCIEQHEGGKAAHMCEFVFVV